MARICRSWRTVRGIVATRTSAVKAMMAMPICEKQSTYNTSRVLSIGRMMTSFQSRMNMAKNSTGPNLYRCRRRCATRAQSSNRRCV